MKKKFLMIAGFIMGGSLVHAGPLGFLEPYNFMIESEPLLAQSKWQSNFFMQSCFNTTSYDENGDKVNALQIYESQQNMLGLFQGSNGSNDFSQVINGLAAGAGAGVNNGFNGLFTPTGDFSGYQVAFLGSYKFHNNCYFKIALPVYNLELSNVEWTYNGDTTTFAGQQIQTEFVDDFLTYAQNEFGLLLTGWKTSGLGDLALLLDYIGDHPQGRPVLRNVRVHLRLGLTFPTGQVANENWVMSQPLGNDGSMTLPFGGGLDINLGRYFQCGFRGQFSYIWGNEKLRRVPTFSSQTTLLFPTVFSTFKTYGITQTFDLYGQIYNAIAGLSFKVAYEYYFKSQDNITINLPGINYNLINSDIALEEVTRHNIICLLSFDSAFLEKFDKIHPQVGVYLNIPFNGSLATSASTVGVQLSLDF